MYEPCVVDGTDEGKEDDREDDRNGYTANGVVAAGSECLVLCLTHQ